VPQLQRQPSRRRAALSSSKPVKGRGVAKRQWWEDISLPNLGWFLVAASLVTGALGLFSQSRPSTVGPLDWPAHAGQTAPSAYTQGWAGPASAPDTGSAPGPQSNTQPVGQPNPGPSVDSLPQANTGPRVNPDLGGGGPSAYQGPVRVEIKSPSSVGKLVPLESSNVTAVELGTVIPCQQSFCRDNWPPLVASLESRTVSGEVQILNPLANALEVVNPSQFQALMASEAGPFIVSNNALNYCGSLSVPRDVFKLFYGPYVFNAWVALTPAQQGQSLVPSGKSPLTIEIADLSMAIPIKSLEQGFADREEKYPVSLEINALSVQEMLAQGYVWLEQPVAVNYVTMPDGRVVAGFEASERLAYWPQAFRFVFPASVGVRVDYFTPLYQRQEGFDWPAKAVPGINAVPQGRINIAIDEPTWTKGTKRQDPLLFRLTLTGPKGDSEILTFQVWARLPRELS